MIELSKFKELEQQLNAHIADVVTDVKNQIEGLQTTLRNIALSYPNHESVKTHLQEYLPKNELKILSGSSNNIVKNINRKASGRRRIVSRLKVEYVDGATVELKPNPSRIKLAKLIQNNPSGIAEIQVGGDENNIIYVVHKDSSDNYRFSNPLPHNTSGIKTVSVS
jgi:SMC interacting uncharacterized protein involved in chromosome segregation